MKWKSAPLPKYGTARVTRRFAWLPVSCDNGYTVWLELYAVTDFYAGGETGWVKIGTRANLGADTHTGKERGLITEVEQ